jgi:hypothetical protein
MNLYYLISTGIKTNGVGKHDAPGGEYVNLIVCSWPLSPGGKTCINIASGSPVVINLSEGN